MAKEIKLCLVDNGQSSSQNPKLGKQIEWILPKSL